MNDNTRYGLTRGQRARLKEALIQVPISLAFLGATVYSNERFGISPLLIVPPLVIAGFGYFLWKDFGKLERIVKYSYIYIIAWALLAFGVGLYGLLINPVRPSQWWGATFVIGLYIIVRKFPNRSQPESKSDAL